MGNKANKTSLRLLNETNKTMENMLNMTRVKAKAMAELSTEIRQKALDYNATWTRKAKLLRALAERDAEVTHKVASIRAKKLTADAESNSTAIVRKAHVTSSELRMKEVRAKKLLKSKSKRDASKIILDATNKAYH